jgi:hypothetical protein
MKKIAILTLIIMGIPLGLFAKDPQIIVDAIKSAKWISKALNSSGYKADFSLESLKEIDRFFDEHSENGKPKVGGLLGEQLGSRIFSIGSYVGEVLKKEYGGKWVGNDSDPDSEINLELRLNGDIGLYPIKKTIKRLQNGSEDSLYFYGKVAGEIQNEQTQHQPSADR